MSGISFQFGTNCVIPLLDAATDTPIEFMYAPGANTRPFLELLTAEQEFRMAIGSFYVETDGRHILIDLGQGLPTSLPSYGHMMENFERAGLENEKITDVVFTHLHLDHIGWASHEGKSVFPNATYWVHQADMEYFVDSQNESISGPDIIQAKDRLKPVEAQIRTFTEDFFLTPSLQIVHAPGHTPGEIVLSLTADGQRLLFLGDVVHHPAELVDETWYFTCPGSDADPILAEKTRQFWRTEVAKENTFCTAAHFPEFQIGRVVTDGLGKRHWQTIHRTEIQEAASVRKMMEAQRRN